MNNQVYKRINNIEDTQYINLPIDVGIHFYELIFNQRRRKPTNERQVFSE